MTLAVQELGERLAAERARRFVGREAQLDQLRARLAGVPAIGAAGRSRLFSVLWVHGPGGIGKSSLLAAYADAARAAGWSVALVDAGRVPPTPDGIRAPMREFGPDDRCVVIFDGAEQLSAVEEWLRDELLPGLPPETVVIIAGRRPPSHSWRSDPGWRELLHVIPLRNLTPNAVAALLDVERLPPALLEPVMRLTHGHPLAVSMLIDAICRSEAGMEVPDSLQDLPDVVSVLLRRLVDEAPSGLHRVALQVCAHAPATTEPVLRAVLPDTADAEISKLWDWLHGLTFVDETPIGLRPQEIARDAVEAELRSRDPAAYASIHRRLRGHVVDRLKAAAGDPEALQRAAADLLFLVRNHPVAGLGWDWDAFGQPPGEPVGDEHDAIIAMTRTAQGRRQAELAEHWLRRQPNGFRMFRDSAGQLAGYVARLALHAADPADIEADPGTAALWRFATEHHPPRPGEQVLAWRFLVDREPDERRPRLAGTLFGVWHLTDILLRPPTAWDFVANYTDLAHWEPFFRHWDFAHAPEADYRIGPTRYRVFAHDWRRVPVSEWLERTAARELGQHVALEAAAPAAELSRQEFAASVKQALRDLHRPHELVRNPLTASTMVQERLREQEEGRPDRVLRDLLYDAARVLESDPRDGSRFRVIDRTFLRPAPSQEKAAELLDLPFSTYRRYRDRGLEVITDWLWELDLGRSARRAS
jgi:hypothetical protein